MVDAGVNFYLWPESERQIAQNLVQPSQGQARAEGIGAIGLELIAILQDKLAIYEPQSTY